MKKLRPAWRLASNRLLQCLLDPVYFWMTLGTYEDELIVFDEWQIRDLHDYSRVRAREKAPQIGASWLRAAEAVWESMLFEDAMTAFVSMDQREASEKVLYAKKLYDGLPPWIQTMVPLVKDSVEEVSWGTSGRPSRVISLPNSSAVRGRKMSVVLDESDFYKDGGRDSFRAGMGRIARGGRLTIQSTCFGQQTKLDNLVQGVDESDQETKTPISIARYPYTVVENPLVIESIEMAEQTLDEHDFLEEYACVRGLASADPFPADLLRRQWTEEDPVTMQGGTVGGTILMDREAQAVAGYDVGKGSGRNPSILSLFVLDYDGKWHQRLLHQPAQGFAPLKLPDQHHWLQRQMREYPNLILVPDGQGIGAQIAQGLTNEFGRRVITMIPGSKPANLPPQSREEMTTELKRQLEANEMFLLNDRDQTKQFRQTKRGPDGKVLQGGSKTRTHYDRYWATAYAAYGISALRRVRSPYADHGLRVIQVGGRSGVA